MKHEKFLQIINKLEKLIKNKTDLLFKINSANEMELKQKFYFEYLRINEQIDEIFISMKNTIKQEINKEEK